MPRSSVMFDKGQIPTVSLIDRTKETKILLSALKAALVEFIEEHFTPIWGIKCSIQIDTDFVAGNWALVFSDNADMVGALGYHDLTPDYLPLGYAFTKAAEENHDPISVVAAHELIEMLIDPGLQMGAQAPDGKWYAYEICDPVQGEGFYINEIAMPNFVYPAYFEAFRPDNSTQFDHLNKLSRPFQLLPRGYIPYWFRNKWRNSYGSVSLARKYAKRDTRMLRVANRCKYIETNGYFSGLVPTRVQACLSH